MIITNKHSNRKVFLDNGESFVHWRKFCAKVCRPSWTSYIVVLCSLWALLFCLGLNSWLTCVGLLWDHNAYVAAVAIAVGLKPRPTIRVLAAVETRALTELGYTAPSLLRWGVLGPKRTRQWKCAKRLLPELVLFTGCRHSARAISLPSCGSTCTSNRDLDQISQDLTSSDISKYAALPPNISLLSPNRQIKILRMIY